MIFSLFPYQIPRRGQKIICQLISKGGNIMEVGQTKKEMRATAERLAQYPKGCSDTQKRNMHKGDTRRINRANTCILKLRKLNIHIIING